MEDYTQNTKDISNINFEPLTYKQSLEILKKMSNQKEVIGKQMIIFAGANGAGKSTLIANFYKNGIIKNLPYINADMEMLNKNQDAKTATIETFNKVVENIKQSHSFVYETVFSDINKIELVSFAKKYGYEVFLFQVATNSSSINIERVAKRVSEGGHSVPKDKISSRWAKANDNIYRAKFLCDKYYVFDNSKNKNLSNEMSM